MTDNAIAPWDAINANERLTKALKELNKMKHGVTSFQKAYTQPITVRIATTTASMLIQMKTKISIRIFIGILNRTLTGGYVAVEEPLLTLVETTGGLVVVSGSDGLVIGAG